MADSTKNNQWSQWFTEFQDESDRACAVLGAAFLDKQLRIMLELFFVDDPKKMDHIFENNGPLATFSSKINIAYALGFLSPGEIRDLNLIRKIRNLFAHKLHGFSFKTSEVANRCAELTICNNISLSDSERNRFIISVAVLASLINLRGLEIRDKQRTIRTEAPRNYYS